MERPFDAVVIGSGINELVAANYLARAGQRVVVLDDRAIPGREYVTEESVPGFRFNTCADDIGFLDSRFIEDLGLRSHGLDLLSVEPAGYAPTAHGDGLLLRGDADAVASIFRHSAADAGAWPAFNQQIARLAGFLGSLYGDAPPLPTSRHRTDLLGLFGIGRRLRGLGKADMLQFLRTVPMSAADLLDEWFESDHLKGVLGGRGIQHLFQGPRSAGTAFVLLHHSVGTASGPGARTVLRGGVGMLALALARALGARGGELRTGTPVERVLVDDGRVRGVQTGAGDEIRTALVLCGRDPKHTFLRLVDPVHSEPDFLHQVQNIRLNGVAAKVNVALAELPDFGCPEAHLRGKIIIAPSLDYVERAYDEAKYGRMSHDPYLEVSIPSLVDPSLAPPGKHVLSIWMQYAPYRLAGDRSWDEAAREALGHCVLEALARYAPNLPDAVIDRQVLSPADIEERFGLTGGHLYQGDLTLDQVLFMRPIPGWSRYAMPIEGLYLCGPATHPGGAIPGMPGYLAARQILKRPRRPIPA